jgi:hypothetical protein
MFNFHQITLEELEGPPPLEFLSRMNIVPVLCSCPITAGTHPTRLLPLEIGSRARFRGVLVCIRFGS